MNELVTILAWVAVAYLDLIFIEKLLNICSSTIKGLLALVSASIALRFDIGWSNTSTAFEINVTI